MNLHPTNIAAAAVIAIRTTSKQTNLPQAHIEYLIAIKYLLDAKTPTTKANLDKVLARQTNENLNKTKKKGLTYNTQSRVFLTPIALKIIQQLNNNYIFYINELENNMSAQKLRAAKKNLFKYNKKD